MPKQKKQKVKTKGKNTKKQKSSNTKSTAKSVTTKTIAPDITLAELLTIDGAYEILAKLGVPCVVCPLMGMEMHFLTIEAIAKMYNLDLEKILKELNNLQDKK